MDTRLGKGGALEALIEAREQGLVRHIGCTAHTSRALLQALERFDFETILVPMNLVEREPLERLIPLCQERGVGVTIMKPVATGLLPARPALKWLLNQPIATAVPGVTTLEELELDAAVGNLEDYALSAEDQAEIEALREQLEHVRCRICGACEPCCGKGILIGFVLGTDVMYNHYRALGREGFATAPWRVAQMERDLRVKEELVAKIESCDRCRECEARCPHGLPIVEMLQGMLPGLREMMGIYRERLGMKDKGNLLSDACDPLILLVHPSVARLGRGAEELCKVQGWPIVSLGRIVAEDVSSVLSRERPRAAERAVHSILDQSAPGPIICVDIDLLFEPSLQLDPLLLFRQASRTKRLIVAWPGSFDGLVLSYAVPEHGHYRAWRNPEARILLLGT